MTKLDAFMQILTGSFDNSEQYNEMKRTGAGNFPYARHINTVCNDKITHLPDGTLYGLPHETLLIIGEYYHRHQRFFCFCHADYVFRKKRKSNPTGNCIFRFLY